MSAVRHDPCPMCGGDLLYQGDVEAYVCSLFECERCGLETLLFIAEERVS